MTSVTVELDDIYRLAHDVMLANGCDADNAGALADIICRAERDGSHSHGCFGCLVMSKLYVAVRWMAKLNRQLKP